MSGTRRMRTILGAFALVAAEVGVLTAAAVTTAPIASAVAADGSQTWYHQYDCIDGSYTVPPYVNQVTVEAVGDAGEQGDDNHQRADAGLDLNAGGAGGLGTKLVSTVNVTPGQVLYVGVASRVFAGGRGGFAGTIDPAVGTVPGDGGNGGNASFVSADNGCSQPNPLAVAAGGGGGGGAGTNSDGNGGGNGGGEGVHGVHGGDPHDDHHGGGGWPVGSNDSQGGTGGSGWLLGGFPLFKLRCNSGDDGARGAAATGGRGGTGGIESSYKDGCGSAGSAGYENGNASGGGGGGGGGIVGGGGGGGADDTRSSGGGGAGGASMTTGAEVSKATSSETAHVTITPVHSAPTITGAVPYPSTGASPDGVVSFTVGSTLAWEIRAPGYPFAHLTADDVPTGLRFDDIGDGTGRLSGKVTDASADDTTVTVHAVNDAGSPQYDFHLDVTLPAVASTTISPTPTEAYLVAGRPSVPLTFDITYSNGYLRHVTSGVTWSTTDPTIATIDATGRLTPIATGDVVVDALVDGQHHSWEYHVVDGPVASVAVTPLHGTVALDDEIRYHATVTYESGATRDVTDEVTWSTGDPAIAASSGGGSIRGTGTQDHQSTAVIAHYTDPADGRDLSAPTADVTITLANPSSIRLQAEDNEMDAGTALPFTAIGEYGRGSTADITNQVTWSSSNPAVADLSSADAGRVLADSESPGGETIVSATLGGVTGQVPVRVRPGLPDSMTITPAGTVGLGQTKQLQVTATYGTGATNDVTSQIRWDTDDSHVAVVTGDGLVIGTGTTAGAVAHLTGELEVAGHAPVQISTMVTITLDHPDSITVGPVNPTVEPNGHRQFTAMGHYPSGDELDITDLVTWSASSYAFGGFNGHGDFGVGPDGGGQVTITATAPDGVASGSTLLTREIGNPTSLEVVPGDTTIGLEQEIPFAAIAHYVDGSTLDVTTNVVWSSTNPDDVSVEGDGVATGRATSLGRSSSIGASYTSPYGGTVTGSSILTVNLDHPSSIAVTPNPVEMLANTSQTFQAMATYPQGTTVDITGLVSWSLPSTPLAHTTNPWTVVTEATQPGGGVTLTATAPDGVASGGAAITVEPNITVTGPGSTGAPVQVLSTSVNTPFTSPAIACVGGSGSCTWSVTGLPAGLSVSASPSSSITISGTPTTVGTAHLDLTIRDAAQPASSGVSRFLDIDVVKLDQSITGFTLPASAATGTTIPLSAAGGASGSPVTFVATTSPCTILHSPERVRIDSGNADCVVEARQVGNAIYHPSPSVPRTVRTEWTQTLTWGSGSATSGKVGRASDGANVISTNGFGGSGSGQPVVITIDPATTNAACSFASTGTSSVTFNWDHAGDCVLNATQAGVPGAFAAAAPIQRTIPVGKGDQQAFILSSAPVGAKVGGTSTPNTSGTPNNGVARVVGVGAATTNRACSADGTKVHFDHVGTCQVSVIKPATADWNASAAATQSFAIGKGDQTITFTSSPPSPTTIDSDVYFPTAVGTSGNPATVTLDPGTTNAACADEGGYFRFNHAGTCKLVANLAADDDWNAAPGMLQSFTVGKGATHFAVLADPPGAASVGGSYEPQVFADNGETVTVAVDPATTNAACSLSYGVVSFDANGSCVLTFTAPANADQVAATMQQTIVVHTLHFAIISTPLVAAGSSADTVDFAYLIDENDDVFAPSGDVTLALSSSSPGAIFSDTQGGSSVGSVTFPAGSYVTGFWYGDSVAGTSTITLTDPSGATPSWSFDVTVVAGAASQLGVTSVSDAFAGLVVDRGPVVQVQDAVGNPLPVAGVTVTIAPDHGTIAAGDTAVTDVDGRATFADLRIDTPGAYTLTATSDTGLATTASSAGFAVHGAPRVDSVTPNTGPTSGGDTVVLAGADFTGATAVSFGANPADWFTVDGDGQISAGVPAGSGGWVDVTVTNPVGASATSTAARYGYSAYATAYPTITVSSATSQVGQAVALRAHVDGGGLGIPTGTVELRDLTTSYGTVTLDANGDAKLVTTAMTEGHHDVYAFYSGDLTFAQGNADAVGHDVVRRVATVTITSGTNPSIVGDTVHIGARVTRGFFAPMPTGVVSLFADGAFLGSAPLNVWGAANVSTNALLPGTRELTMVYSGDGTYLDATSAPFQQQVNGRPSSVSLTSATNPSTVGQNVTLTAKVPRAALGPVPTGTFWLYQDGNLLSVTSVNPYGTGTLTLPTPSVGDHEVWVVYSGDGHYLDSVSTHVTQTVQRRSSTTSIISPVNPSTIPNGITISSRITQKAFAPIPTGTITLMDGATTIASSPLTVWGTGSVTTSALKKGDHQLTIVYSGDGQYAPSTSPVLVQTVLGRTTAITLVPPPVQATAGRPAAFSVKIARPAYAPLPTGTVRLLDGGTQIGIGLVNVFGTATVNVPSLTEGSHDLTVVYGGDSYYGTSTSPVTSYVVGPPPA